MNERTNNILIFLNVRSIILYKLLFLRCVIIRNNFFPDHCSFKSLLQLFRKINVIFYRQSDHWDIKFSTSSNDGIYSCCVTMMFHQYAIFRPQYFTVF